MLQILKASLLTIGQPLVYNNIACDFSNICIRKLSKYRNYFKYKTDLQKVLNQKQIKQNSSHRIVSSDIVLGKKTEEPKSRAIKNLSSLQYKGEILFGIHPVYLALLKQKRKLYQLFIKTESEDLIQCETVSRKTEILKMAMSLGILVQNVNAQGLKHLAPGAVHQGVCLDAAPLPFLEWNEKESDAVTANIPLWLVLDEILDPMNVGAIIRSANYFGVKKLFVVRGNSCKLSPTVSKASSGALEIIDIYQIENLEYFIQVMRSKQWNIISTVAYCDNATEPLRAIDVSEFTLKEPTILILGNEGRGISPDIQALCDNFVSIYPSQNLHKGIDSLNVSVATGVILHSLLKSWKDVLK